VRFGLTAIEVIGSPFEGFFQTERYVYKTQHNGEQCANRRSDRFGTGPSMDQVARLVAAWLDRDRRSGWLGQPRRWWILCPVTALNKVRTGSARA
jgi:hypothetical protein